LKGLFETKFGKVIWAIIVCKYLFENRKEIDMIHVLDSFFTLILFSIIAILIKKPIVLKNSINGIYNCDSIYKRIKFFVFRRTSHVISISKKTFDDAVSCGFNLDKIYRFLMGLMFIYLKKAQ